MESSREKWAGKSTDDQWQLCCVCVCLFVCLCVFVSISVCLCLFVCVCFVFAKCTILPGTQRKQRRAGGITALAGSLVTNWCQRSPLLTVSSHRPWIIAPLPRSWLCFFSGRMGQPYQPGPWPMPTVPCVVMSPYTAERSDVLGTWGNLSGLRIENPCPREISWSLGDVFTNASRLEAVYSHSLSISREVLILWCDNRCCWHQSVFQVLA